MSLADDLPEERRELVRYGELVAEIQASEPGADVDFWIRAAKTDLVRAIADGQQRDRIYYAAQLRRLRRIRRRRRWWALVEALTFSRRSAR